MKLEQGKIVKWENSAKQQIVWMVCDDAASGVVIHSDHLMRVGTITHNLQEYNVEPFVGTVNISSAAN
jgi:hypothetical protein